MLFIIFIYFTFSALFPLLLCENVIKAVRKTFARFKRKKDLIQMNNFKKGISLYWKKHIFFIETKLFGLSIKCDMPKKRIYHIFKSVAN